MSLSLPSREDYIRKLAKRFGFFSQRAIYYLDSIGFSLDRAESSSHLVLDEHTKQDYLLQCRHLASYSNDPLRVLGFLDTLVDQALARERIKDRFFSSPDPFGSSVMHLFAAYFKGKRQPLDAGLVRKVCEQQFYGSEVSS